MREGLHVNRVMMEQAKKAVGKEAPMLKRSLVICLALLVLVTLAACDNKAASGGDGTEALEVVQALLKAMEEKDIDAFMAALSPASIQKMDEEAASAKEELAEIREAMIASGEDVTEFDREIAAMGSYNDTREYIETFEFEGYQSLEYDDLAYRSTAGDDIALVGIVGGTATIVDNNGDANTEDASSSGPFYYVLEKTDGEWGVDLQHSNLWTPYCST